VLLPGGLSESATGGAGSRLLPLLLRACNTAAVEERRRRRASGLPLPLLTAFFSANVFMKASNLINTHIDKNMTPTRAHTSH
jgi:hypothetical protein